MTFPSEELIDRTLAFWEPRYGRKLTREEARQIITNLTRYVEVLNDMDQAERAKKAAAAPSAPTSSS